MGLEVGRFIISVARHENQLSIIFIMFNTTLNI